MSNLDVIRERLEDDKYADLKEVASALLSALDSIEALSKQARDEVGTLHNYVHADDLVRRINYWVEELAEETLSCAHETYPATLETPAEFCEEDSMWGSEYCKEHSE